jgi:hypothetical protein
MMATPCPESAARRVAFQTDRYTKYFAKRAGQIKNIPAEKVAGRGNECGAECIHLAGVAWVSQG